jgi:hypothetical protein
MLSSSDVPATDIAQLLEGMAAGYQWLVLMAVAVAARQKDRYQTCAY